MNHTVLHKAGLSLQTQHSPFYRLLSLPFRIFIQSIYRNVVYHLIPSVSNFLPVCHSFQTILQQAVLSQPVSQPINFFLFLISSSIILPSPTLSSTAAFFFLSILHAPSSITTSQMLPVVFAHSVVVCKYLHHTTLHSTQSTSLISSLVIFPSARRKCFFSC